MQKRISYKTAISDFRNFESFGNLEIFSTFFIIFTKIPQISNFSKNRNTSTIRASIECMYQVSSHSLHKSCLYSILNVKNGYFSGHLDVIQCNSIYSFFFDFYATNDVLVIFIVLDEKPTHKHVLRRQMTEIGNFT